jgi:hypothetical protein
METFRYPRRFKIMTLVSAVVFTVMALLLIGWAELNGIRHLEVFALILFMLGMYVWWCVVMYRRADDTVTVDDSSLVYRAPRRPTVILPWSSVRIRSRDMLLHLEVSDRSGARPGRILLGYQLDDFGRLAQIVRERMAPEVRSGPAPRVFVRSFWAITAPLHWPLAFIGVAVWAWSHGREQAAIFIAGGIVWSVVSAMREPWRVRVLDDGFAIDYAGRSKRIPFAEVRAVRLHELKEYGKGRTRLADTQAVDIETARGTVRLAGFRDGSLELYRALDDVWRAAKGSGARGAPA